MTTNIPDGNVPKAEISVPKVTIIVVNWNGWKDTLECFESLLPIIERREATIICCDNGSTDDSVRHILHWANKHFRQGFDSGQDRTCAASCPAFTLLGTDRNLGYAGGNNVGIRRALELASCEFVWLLNNDTIVTDRAVSTLLLAARNTPNVAAFGSTTVDYFNPSRVQCAGGCRYHPMLTVTRQALRGWDLEEALARRRDIKLDYIAGSAMFLRTAAMRNIGLLNETFFLYYEEADYARRLKEHGYRISWCKESIVFHKGGQSTRSRSQLNPEGSWLSEYHENLSTLKYTANHHQKLFPLAATFRFAAKLLLAAFRRPRAVAPLLRAYRDFFGVGGKSPVARRNPASIRLIFSGGLCGSTDNDLHHPC